MTHSLPLESLRSAFGERMQENVALGRFTAARVGGPADVLVVVEKADQLADAALRLWEMDLGFTVLGGGSNVLVSDSGVRGVIILNHAREVRFDEDVDPPVVWAESGANLGLVARRAAEKGLSGLEWAAGIPGTVGGAVVGNAGAHGGDIAGNIILAEILHLIKGERDLSQPICTNRESWTAHELEYSYRTSRLKRNPGTVVLSASLQLQDSTPDLVQAKIGAFKEQRRKTQPPGASMGSMFKNPPGEYAGRLIEAAGLKGTRVGDAEINRLHANFFINLGSARADDVYRLLKLAQDTVAEKFHINLELEIELIGDWNLTG
ncbi:MAG: UDP-N-acetylmuramate dehydrogenase [Chloroflexi bacterium]|nr:MAG: UDP-N-acetylmuramate dehydrogenase [Chloroflexota bacterium]